MASAFHTPVLLQEAISFLVTKEGVYVDATLGGGGHAEAILERLGTGGSLVGIDADRDAIDFAAARLTRFGGRVILEQANFLDMKTVLSRRGLSQVRGILFDLGVSSFQFDKPEKGFSYRSDGRLDMRLDQRHGLTASDVINNLSEGQLADLFWKYGEERSSRRIARSIVEHRKRSRIETTGMLTDAIRKAVGGKFVNKSLSRIFQAIRIHVNNELENLRIALKDSIELLMPGGRLVVISYHSLEDRIVKETFRNPVASAQPGLQYDHQAKSPLKILTKKVVRASAAEIENNPRARSAKLRAAEKL